MSFELFTTECPGAAFVLGRFLNRDQLELIGRDYECVAACDGNDELGVVREEGVSFNKRIARALMIIAKEAGCQDVDTLRLGVYSCAADTVNTGDPQLDRELLSIRGSSNPPTSQREGVVRGALLLDRCRHLHMMGGRLDARAELLRALKAQARLVDGALLPEVMRKKIQYSLTAQTRRIDIDGSLERGAE